MRKITTVVLVTFCLLLFAQSHGNYRSVDTGQLRDADSCINNTRNEGECKDCCDCLNTDGAARKACRDQCPNHDFSENTDFIPVHVQSTLGPIQSKNV